MISLGWEPACPRVQRPGGTRHPSPSGFPRRSGWDHEPPVTRARASWNAYPGAAPTPSRRTARLGPRAPGSKERAHLPGGWPAGAVRVLGGRPGWDFFVPVRKVTGAYFSLIYAMAGSDPLTSSLTGKHIMRKTMVTVLALLLGGCGPDTPQPDAQELPRESGVSTTPATPVDGPAVQAMLEEFSREYNAGRYVQASAYYTSRIESQCGGATGLAHALAQAHAMEGIDYAFQGVSAWGNDPSMADVTVFEDGEEFGAFGFRFAYERGRWRFDETYPIAMGVFCR
jgi:hypothetical protein